MSDLLLCSHFLNQIAKTGMLHLLASGNDSLIPRPCPAFCHLNCNTKKAVQVDFFIHLWGEPGNKATVMLKIYHSKFRIWSTNPFR